MELRGETLVGASAEAGTGGAIDAIDMGTGQPLSHPAYRGSGRAQLERACALADEASYSYGALPLERRAALLEAIAQNVLDLGDALIVRCMAETGLPRARLEGERGRTVGQLRLFAAVVRDGDFLDLRIDPALPDRKPLPRPDLRLRQVPLGPVAVFGASNFPLAFSVAGGDTAAALAAGCPVVAKAHSAHPGTSELVGQAVREVVAACGLPEGTFSLLFDDGTAIGLGLVTDPRIRAVGFTGSRRGGLALVQAAAARPEPIPVYAEMSSINPVLLLPGALAARGPAIARGFVAALTLGAGQFCTNPGLVLVIEGEGLEAFLRAAAEAVAEAPAATMLTPGIAEAYRTGVQAIASHKGVRELARGAEGTALQGRAALFAASGEAFLANHALQDEVFGAASLVVRCRDEAELAAVVASLEGQLTAALHLTEADHPLARRLLPLLERKVGRILVGGFGTGVEVSHAMVHGGPFPSTSDGRSTSVGSLAVARFQRPVCYQDIPEGLLPEVLRDGGLAGLPHRRDGRAVLPSVP